MIPLKLTRYEQSALAELAQVASGVQYCLFGQGKEPTPEMLDKFAEAVMRYDQINWGTLYDKLHRSGENS